jgi:hypothetical protein
MGWHTRHASTCSGLEGHLRPETLNLTAWNHALGLTQLNLLFFSHIALCACCHLISSHLISSHLISL